jgi:hypothetical protein
MKKLILLLVFLVSYLTIETASAQAIIKDNIARQPIWGPVGYKYVKYYYLPDIQTYYDVRKEKFIFSENGVWKIRRALPGKYFGFNLYNARIVVVNKPKPYLHYTDKINKRILTDNNQKQQIIRDSHEFKYMANKNHPDHLKWLETVGNERRKNSFSL